MLEQLLPLLRDPVLGVRIAVIPVLAAHYPGLDAAQKALFGQVQEEYWRVMNYTADMPGTRLNMGNTASALGDSAGAEHHYRRALALDARYIPAGMNLAVLLGSQQRNDEARQLLEGIVAEQPLLGEAAFSLGLLLSEMREYPLSLVHLRNAARLMPDYARAHYNLGQLADFLGEEDEAARALERAVSLVPQEATYLAAAAEFYARRRRIEDFSRMAAMVDEHHAGSALQRHVRQLMRRF